MVFRTFDEERLDRLAGGGPCSLPRLTERKELVDARFCREGVDRRRSSCKEALLGVLRKLEGVFDFEVVGVVKETLRVPDEEVWLGERGEGVGDGASCGLSGNAVLASDKRWKLSARLCESAIVDEVNSPDKRGGG